MSTSARKTREETLPLRPATPPRRTRCSSAASSGRAPPDRFETENAAPSTGDARALRCTSVARQIGKSENRAIAARLPRDPPPSTWLPESRRPAPAGKTLPPAARSEEHTSELQSPVHL